MAGNDFRKYAFTTAWQIKDLFSRFAPNCGRERFRFVVETSHFDNFNSHTNGRLAFTKCMALSSSFAFTLAEVLITLAIIGVVAALTIPTVVRNYQKHQTVVQLKKAYSQLNQAVNMSEIDNGSMENWDFALDPAVFFENYFQKYLKISKYYGKVTPGALGAAYKEINGNALNNEFTTSTNVKFTLADGTLAGLTVKNGGNIIYVDTNGIKPPNKRGRDLFMFTVTSRYKVMPYGFGTSIINEGNSFGTTFDRNTLTGMCKKSNGIWCTALIMADGWEIKDDYPWQ